MADTELKPMKADPNCPKCLGTSYQCGMGVAYGEKCDCREWPTLQASKPKEYRIVFDSLPSPEGCRFVEVEDENGRSINAGEWRKRSDGLAELVITTPTRVSDMRDAEGHKHAVALRQCAIFANDAGEHIAKAMLDAADYLDRLEASGAVLCDAQPVGVICQGCGSSWSDERLKEERQKRPALISCCPERRPITVYARSPSTSQTSEA